MTLPPPPPEHIAERAIPATLLSRRANRTPGGLWLSWNALLGVDSGVVRGAWLPIGMAGATLLVANCDEDATFPYPSWAVQRILVSAGCYEDMVAEFEEAVPLYRQGAEEFTAPLANPHAEAPRGLGNLDVAKHFLANAPLTNGHRDALTEYCDKGGHGVLDSGLCASFARASANHPVICPSLVNVATETSLSPALKRDFAWIFSERRTDSSTVIYIAYLPGVSAADISSYQSNVAMDCRGAGVRAQCVAVLADEVELRAVIAGKTAPVVKAPVHQVQEKISEGATSAEKAFPVSADILSSFTPTSRNTPGESLLEWVCATAIASNAADIHIELMRPGVGRVRIRVDGGLRTICELRPEQLQSLISAAIDNSNKDISITWKPQDGRFNILWTAGGGKQEVLNIRANVYPNKGSPYPTVTLRLLRKVSIALNDLGLSDFEAAVLKRAVDADKGFGVICGPTGSGKSTTLVALLRYANKDDIKIITAEDPIEYEIDGITQGQIDRQRKVDEKGNVLDAACYIRAMLRQDIDTALVGEIRDEESAKLAVDLSNTGHVVLSTLHSNDSVLAFSRLRDLGIRPADLAETVSFVSAQRLARKVCPKCKVEKALSSRIKEQFERAGLRVPDFYYEARKNEQCPVCRGHGVSGRRAIMEMTPVTTEFADALVDGAPISELRKLRRDSQGPFPTLFDSALRMAAAGVITYSEATNQQYLWDDLPTR